MIEDGSEPFRTVLGNLDQYEMDCNDDSEHFKITENDSNQYGTIKNN